MRFVRRATWTSGEPVSVPWIRYCPMTPGFSDSYCVTLTFSFSYKLLSLLTLFYKPPAYHVRAPCDNGSPAAIGSRQSTVHSQQVEPIPSVDCRLSTVD